MRQRMGGFVALVTTGDLEVSLGVWESPDLHLLHIGAGYSQGNAVLLLAGDGTGVTPDAPGLVQDLAPFGVLCDAPHGLLL